MDCVECRKLITAMFEENFTPKSVGSTRLLTDPHLLECKECRIFLKEMYERKREEVGK
jgi:predicted anti-sigma-YlaC factor YlaD